MLYPAASQLSDLNHLEVIAAMSGYFAPAAPLYDSKIDSPTTGTLMEIALEKTCRPSPCGGTSRLSLAPPALPPRRPPPAPTSWLRPHAWASIRSRAVSETS